MKTRFGIAALVILAGIGGYCAYRAPSWSKDGMVATPHVLATEAAVQILQSGGNAFDAAVAAAFALSVVEQYHSGLGGGEFAVGWVAESGETFALDARECAPVAATRDMYIDPATGEPYPDKSQRGGLAVGVPGSVTGRVALIERYGNLSLQDVVAPAVKLAREGFTLDRIYADRIKRYGDILAENRATADIFMHLGLPHGRGEMIWQPQLANCLERIGWDGGKAFMHGDDAQAIARACRKAGGILTTKDLDEYQVFWRDPVRFSYKGCEIISMPPPSSGGLCLALILNILEGFPLDSIAQGSAESNHLLASVFEAAFADRQAYLGDPDFTPQPIKGMASEDYAVELRLKMDRNKRTPVQAPGNPWMFDDSSHTSHLSVIDREGNMCSITTSVNGSFGSLVFVPELGIFLNNTMDDFDIAPGDTNMWGLAGGDVNAIAPGKRPLSSMSPTVILKDGKPFVALGSVGGPRIITSVAQMIVNIVDYGNNVQAAMDTPRIHMQWKPDKLYVEEEIVLEVLQDLERRGWTVERDGHWSLSQAVQINPAEGVFYGASDARGVGAALPAR